MKKAIHKIVNQSSPVTVEMPREALDRLTEAVERLGKKQNELTRETKILALAVLLAAVLGQLINFLLGYLK